MIDPQEKVTKVEDLLNLNTVSKDNQNVNTENKVKKKRDKKKKLDNDISKNIPRGKPKSGRIWKEPKQRFSSIIKSRGIRISVEKKLKLRQDLKRVKDLSNEIKAKRQAEKQEKKERRKANIKRLEENSKKSEVVQVIKNPLKIKRMKKKQLRMIEKRDTLYLKGTN